MTINEGLSLIISFGSFIFAILAYCTTRTKNSIDQLPYFDINNSLISITYDSSNRYTLNIPLINIGNGIATNISTKPNNNAKILYDTANKGYYTYCSIEKDISLNSNEINFDILFADLENINYIQNFTLKIFINNKQEYDKIPIITHPNNVYNNFYYFFLEERKTQRPFKYK